MSDKVDESEEKVTTSDYVTAIGDGSVNSCSSKIHSRKHCLALHGIVFNFSSKL